VVARNTPKRLEEKNKGVTKAHAVRRRRRRRGEWDGEWVGV
jgi:hypothetical protein